MPRHAQDLLARMLKVDLAERLSMEEARASPPEDSICVFPQIDRWWLLFFPKRELDMGDTTFKRLQSEDRGGEGSPAQAPHRDFRPPARPHIGSRWCCGWCPVVVRFLWRRGKFVLQLMKKCKLL